MNLKVKRILAVLVVVVTLVGWYVSLFGLGSDFKNVKDQLKYGLDINGGVFVVLEANEEDIKGYTDGQLKEIMEQTRDIINNRVNNLGVAEANVTIEGTKRIRVELPGVENTDEAIKSIGTTAKLIFMLADGEYFDGGVVKEAYATPNGSNYQIALEFDSTGTALFTDFTTKAYNQTVTSSFEWMTPKMIAIILDGAVITSPEVSEVISTGKAVITGAFTLEEATTKAALIKAGALPIGLTEIQSSTQSATIGINALEKSITAGAIGLLLVFAIMIAFFGLLGLLADIALLLYVVMFLWAMVAFNVVLTLPGIAALILSVGMAVDANVIIFDRIKEEIASGKSIRVAVDLGFRDALSTVLDAQITTLIASIVLFEIGTTSVKGFALTLMIGIVFSIFTAVVITQIFISVLAGSKKFSKNKFFGVSESGNPRRILNKTFSFIRNRKIYYLVSVVILVIGLIFGLVKGMNYGIDFTGGTMIQMDLHKEVPVDEIKDLLKEFDIDPEIVYQGEGNQQIVIKTIKALEAEDRAKLTEKITKAYSLKDTDVLASEEFGPSVGRELKG
ncbi:MAG: protein translocase subunit SecD, partial [Clostridia bacterium]|nr:protein translocase subunit SecD [Clostridia bacterium]